MCQRAACPEYNSKAAANVAPDLALVHVRYADGHRFDAIICHCLSVVCVWWCCRYRRLTLWLPHGLSKDTKYNDVKNAIQLCCLTNPLGSIDSSSNCVNRGFELNKPYPAVLSIKVPTLNPKQRCVVRIKADAKVLLISPCLEHCVFWPACAVLTGAGRAQVDADNIQPQACTQHYTSLLLASQAGGMRKHILLEAFVLMYTMCPFCVCSDYVLVAPQVKDAFGLPLQSSSNVWWTQELDPAFVGPSVRQVGQVGSAGLQCLLPAFLCCAHVCYSLAMVGFVTAL